MIEWIFLCTGPMGWPGAVTCVAVWEKLGVSALIPLSRTPTICGGTASEPSLTRWPSPFVSIPPPSTPISSNGLDWFVSWADPVWSAGTFLAFRVIISSISWMLRISGIRASLPRER